MTMASTEEYLNNEGLSLYDRLLKEYINKKCSVTYATEDDIKNVVKGGDAPSNKEAVVNVKSLGIYTEILKEKLKFSVVDSKPMVEIDGELNELATKEYADSLLLWKDKIN